MRTDDFPYFRAVLAGMAKLYERELDNTLLDAYWLALRDWTLPDFEQAAARLMATSEFMPRPAAFNALRKATQPTAGEAWITARKALRWGLYGHTLDPNCDPLIAKAIEIIGGPSVIAMTPDDKLPFVERRFAEIYTSLEDSATTRAALPGIANPQLPPNLRGLLKAIP